MARTRLGPTATRGAPGAPGARRARPWYVTKDLAALALVMVLAVVAIVVLTALPHDLVGPARAQNITQTSPRLDLPANARPRARATAPVAAGITAQATTLQVRGGIGTVTGISGTGIAVGTVTVGSGTRAVCWHTGTGPHPGSAANPRQLPGSIGFGQDPVISADGLIAYTASTPDLAIGRPAALLKGTLTTVKDVSAGSVVDANSAGQVLLTQIDLTGRSQTGQTGQSGQSGQSGSGAFEQHGYIWEPSSGTLTLVGEVGSRITDDGSVLVLRRGDVPGQARGAYLWHDGTTTLLPEPTGWTAQVAGGSGFASMVGTLTQNTSKASQAVVWHDGKLAALPGLGGKGSTAVAASPAGVIVGAARLPGGQPRAMRWDAGTGQDLGTLGGDRSWALGVSEAGVVVGWATTSSGVQHAVAWLPSGQIVDLGGSGGGSGGGSLKSAATGINGDKVYGTRAGPGKSEIPMVWTLSGLSS